MDNKNINIFARLRKDTDGKAESTSYHYGAFRLLFVCSCIAAAILAVMRTLALYFYYEEGLGLMESGAVLPKVTDLLAVICVCISVLIPLIFFKNKKMPTSLPNPGPSVISTGILCGLAMIGLFAFLMYRGVNPSVAGSGLVVWTIMLIFMIPAALYFFKTANSKHPFSRASAALGFAPILWAAFFLISVFFERDTTLNNTIRVYTQMSLISVMVFFLNEVRFLVCKAKPLLYCGMGSAAVIVIALSSIPKLICALLCSIEFSSDIVYGIIELFLLLAIVCRMALYTSKKSSFSVSEAEKIRRSGYEEDTDDENEEV